MYFKYCVWKTRFKSEFACDILCNLSPHRLQRGVTLSKGWNAPYFLEDQLCKSLMASCGYCCLLWTNPFCPQSLKGVFLQAPEGETQSSETQSCDWKRTLLNSLSMITNKGVVLPLGLMEICTSVWIWRCLPHIWILWSFGDFSHLLEKPLKSYYPHNLCRPRSSAPGL